ncbi:MAG TPA: hypothetical protein VH396_13045, partial [Chitinophagaceae bacterium]
MRFKIFFFVFILISINNFLIAQKATDMELFSNKNFPGSSNYSQITSAQPLEELALLNAKGNTIKVFDGNNNEYFSSAIKQITTFTVGGALGTHTIRVYDGSKKVIDSLRFNVDAKTNIDDNGYYKQMFDLFYRG